jgi:hypothetical protein
MTSYRSANEVKASFDDIYQAPTPHAYFATMNDLEYAIGQEARPFFHSTVALMRRRLGKEIPIRMLDLGCSYGVGSALVKYGFSFGEIADFFQNAADQNYHQCVKDTREWLAESEPVKRITCIGADASAEAIKFASEAGLIDGGIAHDLEADQELDEAERLLIRKCNLLISTGAIGYVGEKSLSAILKHLGKGSALAHGPYTVVTILRMFQPEPIAATFNKFGYRFEAVPGVHLRQRRFHDEKEQQESIRLIKARGLGAQELESDGYLYADLFIGSPEADFAELLNDMQETWQRLEASVPVTA